MSKERGSRPMHPPRRLFLAAGSAASILGAWAKPAALPKTGAAPPKTEAESAYDALCELCETADGSALVEAWKRRDGIERAVLLSVPVASDLALRASVMRRLLRDDDYKLNWDLRGLAACWCPSVTA